MTANSQTTDVECTCSTAKLTNGWCRKCKVGYIAGIRIPSVELYELLDAHGHDYDPKSIRCESCKKAMATDGYCEICRMGFLKNQVYMSRLTYLLARNHWNEQQTIDCPACRVNAEKFGWCEKCKRGMVGNTAFRDRTEYDRAVIEIQRLFNSIELLKKCETCAVASFSGGICTKCKLQYKNGKPTPLDQR